MKHDQVISVSIMMLTMFTTTITPSAEAASSGPISQTERRRWHDREGGHREEWRKRHQERDTMHAATTEISQNMQSQIMAMKDAIDNNDVSTLSKEVTKLGQKLDAMLQVMIHKDETQQTHRTQRDTRHAQREANRATTEDNLRQEGRGRGNRWKEAREARDTLRNTSWTEIANLLELQQALTEKLSLLQVKATPEQQAQQFKEIKELHQALVAKNEAFMQAQQQEDQARAALRAERGEFHTRFRRRAQETEDARVSQAVAQAEEARVAQEHQQLKEENLKQEKEYKERMETRAKLATAKLLPGAFASHL